MYIDLLSISHRFLFNNIFRYAVGKLHPVIGSVPAAQRFVLGQKYGVKDWMLSAYETLLDRETAPLAFELEVLGFDKAARLMQARDAMHEQHLQDIEKARQETEAEMNRPPSYSQLYLQPPYQVNLPAVVSPPVARPAAKSFVQQFFE